MCGKSSPLCYDGLHHLHHLHGVKSMLAALKSEVRSVFEDARDAGWTSHAGY